MARVLFVDREGIIRKSVAEELLHDGYEVVTSDRSTGLIPLIQQEMPDVVVIEAHLETETAGLEVLQGIHDSHPNIPIIIYTADASLMGDLRAINSDYYVVKSSGLSDLKETIKAALQPPPLMTSSPYDIAVSKIERFFASAVNRELEPPMEYERLQGVHKLGVYLSHLEAESGHRFTGDLRSFYSHQREVFLLELKKARLIAFSLIGAYFAVDQSTLNAYIASSYRKGRFSVLSLVRFSFEIYSVSDYVKRLREGGYELLHHARGGPNSIVRSIEFEPQYHQSGISILSYFGTILTKKYPDKEVKIRIEQDGLKVTMIIETLEGDKEVIEKTLMDYGLVITGKMPPETLIDDPLTVLELRSELRIANARIENQRELLEYKDAEIGNLRETVGQLLAGPAQPPPNITINVDASPTASAQVSQHFEFSPTLSFMQDGLSDLKSLLPDASDQETIKDLQEGLQELGAQDSPDEVKKSSVMAKIRNFLNGLESAENRIGKTIKGVKKGVKIVQKLAGHYNDIADWCGLPRVPKPFLKSE
ncbi:MAG: response regulator [Thermodesulfobacteriota bacterium]|nr:response regulator [Thermodesulfobacteriota bacterium]